MITDMSTMTNERLGASAPGPAHPAAHLHDALREVGARTLTAAGLFGIGLIHLLDSIGKYGETRYLFWMYIGLILGSLAVAGAVVHLRNRLVWLAAAGLAGSALVGYVINRTVGMPNATGDIGNWTEPLGLASLFVEPVVILVSLYGFAVSRRPTTR